MRQLQLRWLEPHTARLALTYLAIIIAMSLTFSVVLYTTSASKLNTRFETHLLPPRGENEQAPPAVSAPPGTLDTQLAAAREGMAQALIVLNTGVLLLGSGFGWYLARRTLQPIEQALEAQSRFAADASHELRTPLTIMQGEIEMSLHGSRFSPQRAKTALQANLKEIKKLQQLSEGLLQLTQGTRSVQFLPISLAEVANRAADDMHKAAQSKQITIINQVTTLNVQGESSSLVRVLCILLDNAIKYSPDRSEVRMTAHSDARHAYISVHDEGPGIRAADLPHIFERFYRSVAKTARQEIEGYGLGLAIAQSIIQQHRGNIDVSTALGKGTTFTIQIPRAV